MKNEQITPEIKQEELRDNEKIILKDDFPLVKHYNLTEIDIGEHLKFLSLGGNLISSAIYEFPSSLIVLNLSYNIITEFLPQKPLSHLKFLNLSNNMIESLPDISSIITLNELFLYGNKLQSVNFLFSIKNLDLLDVGSNLLNNFEDLAMLSVSTRLRILNLLGNPLSYKPNYKESITQLFPSLICMDPINVAIHSKYQQIGFSIEHKQEYHKSNEKHDPPNSPKNDLNTTVNIFNNHNSLVSKDSILNTIKYNSP